jgi:hypothetical protein
VRQKEKSKRVRERSIMTINYIRLLRVQWKAFVSLVSAIVPVVWRPTEGAVT